MRNLQKKQLWLKYKNNKHLTAEKVAIEQAKANFEMQRMQAEAQIKKELMATEFQYNIQLAQASRMLQHNKKKKK